MLQITATAKPTCEELLGPWGAPEPVLRTVVQEGLLPDGLVERLHALWPEHSSLKRTSPPMFVGKGAYRGLRGFREVCEILKGRGIELSHQAERELFIDVYRFLATRHTLNSIDWRAYESDALFQLVFPQPGMIDRRVVEAYLAAETREQRRAVAAAHMRDTNPHDGNQQLNKPWYETEAGDVELLQGSQHKYPQVALIFDQQTQHCFSFCTYCFRHAQVRGDEDMFLQKDIGAVHAYLRQHPEVNDLLITGGDAGYLEPERLEAYVRPILEDPRLMHVKTIRLGTRLLTYAPERVLDPAYDPMLALFDRLYAHGVQVAWMAHFSTPKEILNPLTIAAIRRLQAHHVVLRSQSPMMKHISLFEGEDGRIDVPRSAKNWIDLANVMGTLCIGFHSIYCPRPTGEHHYFTAPLAEMHRVFDLVYRSLPSINRPSRHLSMTTSAGKISILGRAEVNGEEVFALKFTEGRNMAWLDKVFLAKLDPETNNVAELHPLEGDRFFFTDELADIERDLEATLVRIRGDA